MLWALLLACALCLAAAPSGAQGPAAASDALINPDNATVSDNATALDDATASVGMPNDLPEPLAGAAPEVDLCPGKSVRMTLQDCIALVMRRNVNIRVAYLGRVLQKFDLVSGRDYTFAPDLSLDAAAGRSGSDTLSSTHTDDDYAANSFSRSHARTTTDTLSVGPSLNGLAPTGGRYTLSWGLENTHSFSETRSDTGAAEGGWSPTRRQGLEKTLSLSLTQPLLKGAGLDYNRVPVQQAEITEKTNVLSLKSSIISELTSAVTAYRSLLSAKWSVDISANSLQRAKANLELAKVKIKLGRMARLDKVQYESDVASRELSLAQALNTYDTARLALLQLLDMDRSTCIEPSETIDFAPMKIDDAKLRALVFETKPDWLTALLGIKSSELALLQAERDQLWDLSLAAGSSLTDPESQTDTNTTQATTTGDTLSWNIGLTLKIPIWGPEERGVRRQLLQARSSLHVLRIRLRKYREDLLNELDQRLSNIRLLERQVELSHRSRLLADKKLEVEQIKLQKGRSSTFQLVTFQEQQFQAQQGELSARISYLDALAGLDSFLGTTMDTWGIEFKDYRKEAEDEIETVRKGSDAGSETPARRDNTGGGS